MAERILDGKAIALKVRDEVRQRALVLHATGVVPGLAVVLVGEDPASQVYVRNKTKAAHEAGIHVVDHKLPATTTEDELRILVDALNRDPAVHGILVQLPLPREINAEKILHQISADKDVDGFHPENVGRLWIGAPRFVPCTPAGVMRILAESGAAIEGQNAVIIGRSNIVGKPMAALLLGKSATVTICHSKTRDLPSVVRAADIVIAAIGRAEFVRGDWIRQGATVIDVGINRLPTGKLCGDVEFATASERAFAITPVPGGVGPMTIAMLLDNTVRAAEAK